MSRGADVSVTDAAGFNAAVVEQGWSGNGADLARAVGRLLYPDMDVEVSDEQLAGLVRAHPQVQQLVERGQRACTLAELAAAILPAPLDVAIGTEFVTNLVAALSYLRVATGRGFVGVEAHLWVRELTRIDRVADGVPAFRWSDEGQVSGGLGDLGPQDTVGEYRGAYPAVYCRHCGRSGWGVELAPLGSNLGTDDPHDIRAHHAAREGRFRALIFAAREAAADPSTRGLAWFDTRDRQLLTQTPGEQSDRVRDGWTLPVLRLIEDPDAGSRDDRCPACDRPDGIRFLGSAIATLLSVSLSALFGSPHVDAADKKALVFTDSVQDAAHRAGFVEARSHTLTLRSVFRDALTESPLSLDRLADEIVRRAGDDPFARYRLLPPDLIGRPRFDEFWSAESARRIGNASLQWVRRRLQFDVACEFGVFSRVGRTLEATGAAYAEVDVTPAACLAAARAAIRPGDQDVLDEAFRPSETQLLAWTRGVLEHLRTQGGIDHEWLSSYIHDDGSRYRIWGGRARTQGMPAFPAGRAAPAFARVGPRVERRAEMLLDPVTATQSWYARWTGRVLGVEGAHGARLSRALLDRLHYAGVLLAKPTGSGGTAYGLAPTAVVVAATDSTALQAGEYRLTCTVCGTEQYGSPTATGQLAGAPCLLVRCGGVLRRDPDRDNYYRQLYTADMRRIVAREHTSLLDDETRLAYENGFKANRTDPSAPNVLVATPTLEMGIDIGDLSTVVLASLPRTVASYLQRVGRAGRATGNALDLVFVTGRGPNLPRLAEPLSLVDGPVRPPATYLDAEEILQRQYLGLLLDATARDPQGRHPRKATAAMQAPAEGTFLGELISTAETRAAELVERFLSRFEGLQTDTVTRLRAWAIPEAGAPGSSRLAAQVRAASTLWTQTVESLRHRQTAIETALPELQQRAESPAATEDDRRAARAAEASLRQTKGALAAQRGEYWIQVLEEYGLLPNYTLLSDNVTLDVAVSWVDPETQEYESAPTRHHRPSGAALREFAPGATFYARGMEIEIDAVDLGVDDAAIRDWELCADCGYGREIGTGEGPSAGSQACPRCGGTAIQDAAQRFKIVEMTRVSAQAHRDEARISDRRDERARTRFNVLAAPDVDPAGLARQWFVDGTGFGVRYLRRMTLRWVNVGRRTGVGALRSIAGESGPANLFRVCTGCGVLDVAARANRPDEHRAWCRYRTDTEEHTESLALSRTLVTQAAVMPLPWSVVLSGAHGVPSLQAAILLGLHERFGGAPDHIGVLTTLDPVLGGENRTALLLHDLVPGGTGYLAELAAPERVYDLLLTAWRKVSTCPCRDEGRSACHRCLLPYAWGPADLISRAAAERHLREILVLGSGVAEPPAVMAWHCTETEPDPEPLVESHLEAYFRQAFIDLARGLSATVTEEPQPTGTVVHVLFPGSSGSPGRTWLLEPQRYVLGCKPDFVLSSTDTQIPPIAVFTDGYPFHAAPAHRDTLADDAIKRSTLSDAGYLVWSVTAADLESPAGPDWWREAAVPPLIRRAPGAVSWLPRIKEGPLGMLRSWLEQPSAGAQRDWAAMLPYMIMAQGSTSVSLPVAGDLAGSAAGLLNGESLPAAGEMTTGYWRALGDLGVLIRPQGAGLAVAVVLDDRAAAVGHHDFRASWRRWLSLGNSLQLRDQTTQWTTYSLARSVVGVPVEASAADVGAAALPHDWQAAWALATTAGERAFVVELAASEVPAPIEVGDEIEGLPVDLSWSPQRLAVTFDEVDEETVTEFAALGWRLVRGSLAEVQAAWEQTQEQREDVGGR